MSYTTTLLEETIAFHYLKFSSASRKKKEKPTLSSGPSENVCVGLVRTAF